MAMEIDPYDPETVAVYRLFNVEGALLYVGIARNPPTRFEQHADDKDWWCRVATWTVTWFPNRAAAAAEEARAITEEWPAYNKAGIEPYEPQTYSRARVTEWVNGLSQHRITREDLREFFLIMVRTRSLDDGARRHWHPDEAAEVYSFVYRNASNFARKRHGRFVERWNDEHLRKSIALAARLERDEPAQQRRADARWAKLAAMATPPATPTKPARRSRARTPK